MKNFSEIISAVKTICSRYYNYDCIDSEDFDEYAEEHCGKSFVSIDYSESLIESWNTPMPRALDFYSDLQAIGFEVNCLYTDSNRINMEINLDDSTSAEVYIYIK